MARVAGLRSRRTRLNKAQPRPHPHALRAVLCCSSPGFPLRNTPCDDFSKSFEASGAGPVRRCVHGYALAVADDSPSSRNLAFSSAGQVRPDAMSSPLVA